ncbi:hypothetical protein CK203_040472 [Vitis vinifera]|uniref:Retrotransposon gag domain-containing protein n=1 Tax=Vitis vinifera TaxID=29760 RepID=A0A438I806_VITVI|nr:hypothetical protein CK203_040472 [Vitis vinifera]
MIALLLLDCMSLVHVGRASIPLPPNLLGLATGYIDVREHSGGDRHIDADWSPIIEDLYSLELGSACVEVMTTLHGSTPSLRRRAEGCVPPEGSQFRSRLSLESHSWRRVRGRLIRADSYPSSDSSVEMSDELASTLASIQEFMDGVSRRLDQLESSRQDPHPAGVVTDETIPHASQTAQTRPPGVSLGTPFHLVDHYETIPPPTVTVPPPMVPTIGDTRLAEQEAKVERLESMMRQIRLQEGGLAWMTEMAYRRLACPPNDAQLVALFPMSLSGAAQRWFASVEPSRLRTWEDVAREFLTQFAFSADIDVSRRELEAIRQRPDESISSFVTRWRRRWLDLRSLVHAAFSVEDAMARGLWTDTATSPDSKGKKLIGPLTRSGEVGAISYQHRRPAYHSAYRSPTVRAPFSPPQYQYQLDYAQEPYIAQTSMQPRPPHPRAATHPPPRPYAQRPPR